MLDASSHVSTEEEAMPSHRIVSTLVGAAKRPRRIAPWIGPLAVIAGVAVLFPGVTHAATPVGLGTAESFAVLAGSGITNTGPTTITGDVGSYPLLTQTGFGSVTLNGTNHGGDAVTQQAKTDLTTAYNEAAASGPPTAVPAELGGLTLTPGVYSGATLQITTGTLTLDTLGDPAAVFIFQTGSTLITASDSEVVVLGGGTACNVFWQVSSSATLGTNSHLIGSVLASMSITATTGATVEGRLLAQEGAVTLDTNTITAEVCAPSTTTTTPGATTTTTAPGATTTTTPGATTTTAPGATTTTTPAATTTIAPAEATTTTAEVTSTPGASTTTTGLDLTTATAGASTTTSTPDTVPPSLARTGSDRGLPLLGGLMIALGGLSMGLANVGSRRSNLL
jgi:type VI secretion system secreted protein VgrG